MFPSIAAMSMSNSPSLSTDEAAASSSTLSSAGFDHFACLNPLSASPLDHHHPSPPHKIKKKRNLPGNPDPDAEVIALSPKTLLATNRFVCEICNKGFQRDQNLQLHRRGHNLPWKLKQRSNKDLIKKRAYVCPEPSCVHHHPSRALGDLTGIKKHFCRKHGEKKWKCDKCSKIYAVQSDWKAHSKTCGTREYRCDCGTLFSRKDSFITHRAFCDALAEESARISASQLAIAAASSTPHQISLFPPFPAGNNHPHFITHPPPPTLPFTTSWGPPQNPNPNTTCPQNPVLHRHRHSHITKPEEEFPLNPTVFESDTPPALSPPHDLHRHKQQPADQFITSPSCFRHHHVSTQPASAAASSSVAAATLSATALLQKATTIGASSAAAGSQSAGLAEFAGFMSGDPLATWQKTDRLTRDFLGLTSAEDNGAGPGHGCDPNGNGDVNVVVVKDMLTYAGGPIEFQQYHHYHQDQLRLHGHHHTLLKPQGFGFAETTATSETWDDC